MKKNRLWSMVVAVAVVLLAGCGDKEIKTVKNGVLGIDKSRTVEQALSAKLKDLKWEKFVNDKNQTIVKASGVWTKPTVSYNSTISYSVLYTKTNTVGTEYYKIVVVKPGNKVEVCFVINPDGTFTFNSGKVYSDSADLGFKCHKKSVDDSDLKDLRGGFLGVLYD